MPKNASATMIIKMRPKCSHQYLYKRERERERFNTDIEDGNITITDRDWSDVVKSQGMLAASRS